MISCILPPAGQLILQSKEPDANSKRVLVEGSAAERGKLIAAIETHHIINTHFGHYTGIEIREVKRVMVFLFAVLRRF